MTSQITLAADDPILDRLNFKPYRNYAVRRVKSFTPAEGEPQHTVVVTPWGAELEATPGDFLLSEVDAPDDVWPVKPDIFEATYLIIEPGLCIKRAVTLLVPMAEITGGDAECMVTVQTLEGIQTVRAGDFYLARGVKGEIWPYPNDKVQKIMKPVE